MLTKVNYFASIFVTAPVKEQKVAGDIVANRDKAHLQFRSYESQLSSSLPAST